jgi:hypothetical protein
MLRNTVPASPHFFALNSGFLGTIKAISIYFSATYIQRRQAHELAMAKETGDAVVLFKEDCLRGVEG